MKKLLYIAPVIIDLEKLNGVSKKILNHYKIFNKYYNVEMISYGPNCLYYFHDNIIDKIDLNKSNRRIKLYSYLNNQIAPKNNYDFVYIRYLLSDFLFLNVLRILNKRTHKIVIEIPTFPYKKELLKIEKGLIKFLVDFTSRPFLKFYVSRIITYSNDSVIFGIKTINTINGIIYDDIIQSQKRLHPKTEINLISVSMTIPCHGYDRIIEGLNEYYKCEGNINIFYHLVGNGEEIKKYEKLITKYKLEKNVKLYGFVSGVELNNIYNKADIAIDSLGIHRSGLIKESTLKSREYAAKGLPIISANEVDFFTQEENKKYVFRVPSNESPVDMKKLIQFYLQIYSDNKFNIADQIRNISRNKGDMNATLQGVVEYFNK